MKRANLLLITLLIIFASTASLEAQSTEFTYQGRLLFGSGPANGMHDFEFVLWDALAGGIQVGPTVNLTDVNVNNGVFSVRIDFGDQFPGASRFLEIKVRQSGTGATFSPLLPRQAISSAPYAIKSLNAASSETATNAEQLGGLPPAQFVITSDFRLNDARNPLPNSPNYVQNSTAHQTASNFNISGTGKAAVFDAGSGYHIGGNRVLGLVPGTQNFFAGRSAGLGITTGNFNSFFGFGAGSNSSSGGSNSFFGNLAGSSNSSGSFNSFFGDGAGVANTTGLSNAFFGAFAGLSTTDGGGNSFFGEQAGKSNTSGAFNTFVGRFAGGSTSTGSGNTFFGANAGTTNSTGQNNTLIGLGSNLGSDNLVNATAIGAGAYVTQSNSLVLGSSVGGNGSSADTKVGIGTTAPLARLHVASSSSSITTPIGILQSSGSQIPLAFKSNATEVARIRADNLGNLVLATVAGTAKDIYLRAGDDGETEVFVDASHSRVGIGTVVPLAKFHVNGTGIIGGDLSVGAQAAAAATLDVHGTIRVAGLGSGGSLALCRDANLVVSACASSARYKSKITNFSTGLDLIRRLRPVSYNWIADNVPDIGLVAEEVADVEPRLITRNEKGEVEGVKYDRLTVVLINVVKEQHAEIERLQQKDQQNEKRFNELNDELIKQAQVVDALKRVICISSPAEPLCKKEEER